MSKSPLLKKMYAEWIRIDGYTSVTMSLQTKLKATSEPGYYDSPISKDRLFGLKIEIDNKMKPGEFRFE